MVLKNYPAALTIEADIRVGGKVQIPQVLIEADIRHELVLRTLGKTLFQKGDPVWIHQSTGRNHFVAARVVELRAKEQDYVPFIYLHNLNHRLTALRKLFYIRTVLLPSEHDPTKQPRPR